MPTGEREVSSHSGFTWQCEDIPGLKSGNRPNISSVKSQSTVKVVVTALFQFMGLLASQDSTHPNFQLFMSKNRTRDVNHPHSRKRHGCCKVTCLHPGFMPLLPAKTNAYLVDSWPRQSKRIMHSLQRSFCFSMMQLPITNKIKKRSYH